MEVNALSVLLLKNLRCEIDGRLLFEADRLTIDEGDIIGLIGKNGAGKTCLLKILSGDLNDYSGQVIGNPLIQYSEFYTVKNMVKSGGEINMTVFLKSFRTSASLYLLDEPTTYLDQKNFEKVVRMIKRSTASFCIATHDRALLESVATKIWVIEQGKVREFNGSFSDYLKERTLQLSQYENDLKKYHKERKKIKESLQELKEKKHKKNGKPRKLSSSEYRIAGVKTKIAVKQKKLQKSITQQEDRLTQLKPPNRVEESYDISFISQIHRLPKRQIVIPRHKVELENKPLWSIPDLTMKSGDKLGIIGGNGTGKTTYLNYIESILPRNYKIRYFKQNYVHFSNPEMTVYDVIETASRSNFSEPQIRTLLALLDFKRDKVYRLVGQLSQGERIKVLLLSYLVVDTDILILDEITNYLDIKSIEAVEKVLASYSGILIFVSHDQYFVRHLATKILNIDSYKGE